MYFLKILCVKIMCEMYGGVGGQDGLEHGITCPLLLYIYGIRYTVYSVWKITGEKHVELLS